MISLSSYLIFSAISFIEIRKSNLIIYWIAGNHMCSYMIIRNFLNMFSVPFTF